jgi:hypothetical protein
MNAKYKRLETKFEPETRFELTPVSVAPFRAVFEDKFDRLKDRMLAESLDTVWEPRLSSEVRCAANEAAALARLTPYPLLVFPVLFEEKAEETLREAARQKSARERKCDFMVL